MTTERPAVKTLALATMLAAATVLPTASPAGADELISIPVSGIHRGAEGSTVTVATVDVPADLVGQTCQIVGETVNQHSIHPGNDLLVITNGRTFVIPDFEDEGDIVHDAGEIASLGGSIELVVRFGADGASSGGFKVFVTCDESTNSATTAPEATTPETTAAAPTTTDTTEPGTAVPTTESTTDSSATVSTESAPAGPTVGEQPATTSTTESVVVATTNATAPTTSTTAAPAAQTRAQLPVTGAQTWWIVATGIGLAGTGLALVRRSQLITSK